jgi:hypothetical protein
MALVIPHACEEAMLDLILAPNMTLKLFTNDVASGLSDAQIEALTAGSFTEATFTGYSSKALTGGSWTTTQADPSTGTYAQQTFTRSSTGTIQTVYGYYVVRTSGGALCWYEYFTGPIATQNNGDTIVVTPTFTLDDQEADVAARGLLEIQQFTSNSSGLTATGNTDFVIASFSADATRNYRVHLETAWTLSVAARWYVALTIDATKVARFGDSGDDGCISNFISSDHPWQPSTGTYTLRVIGEEANGTSTFTLIGASDTPRSFWIEDIGPRA